MGTFPYRKPLKWYAIENSISRTIFDNQKSSGGKPPHSKRLAL